MYENSEFGFITQGVERSPSAARRPEAARNDGRPATIISRPSFNRKLDALHAPAVHRHPPWRFLSVLLASRARWPAKALATAARFLDLIEASTQGRCCYGV